jgi:putative NADPH-quinone reductase
MVKKNILVLDAHPDAKSLCSSMVDAYKKGALNSNYSVEVLKIRDLKFDPILHTTKKKQALEKDLEKAQKKILKSDHVVLISPVWWGGTPALFKGFIDRTFVGGFSHVYDPKNKVVKGLLGDRTASVIYTQGGPRFYSKLFLKDSFWRELRKSIFGFCGFKKIRRKYFTYIEGRNGVELNRMVNKVFVLGKKGF